MDDPYNETRADQLRKRSGMRSESEARICSQEGCPGDGRYEPPGKGHKDGCTHDAIIWVWEVVRPAYLERGLS